MTFVSLPRISFVLLASVGLAPALKGADLFPLVAGNSWTLNTSAGQQGIVLTVQSVQDFGNVKRARLQFQSPWIQMTYLLLAASDGMRLEGVDYGSVKAGYPEPAMMYGEGIAGASWVSPQMSTKLTSTSTQVSTPAGTYRNARRYDLTFPDKSVQTWFVAPGFGFVQFGTGTGALQLAKSATGQIPRASAASVPFGACPKVGIEANPPAGGDFSDAGKDATLGKAVTAGSSVLTMSASWAELEPSPSRFDFSSLTGPLARAKKYNLPVAFTLKTIDTTNVLLPSDLIGKPWNDPILLARFQALLGALVNTLNTQVQWVNLGNEVDIYLSAHNNELIPYYQFLQTGVKQINTARANLSGGVVFAFDSTRLNDFVFRVLSPVCQHVSFTYYNGDGSTGSSFQRDPANAKLDIAEMVADAAGRQLVLTEIGYASSTGIGSTPALQSQFYANVLDSLRISSGKVTVGNFSFMSDFPTATVSQLAASYGLQANSGWLAWLSTLGIFDANGAPKPAWSVFSTTAPKFSGALYCTAN